jgi:hypothetical protein
MLCGRTVNGLVSWRKGRSINAEEHAAELYDYEMDPYETTSQAANPKYADVVEQLQNMPLDGPAGRSSELKDEEKLP